MTKDFAQLKEFLIEELKMKILQAHVEISRLQSEYQKPKTMGKHEASQQLADMQKHAKTLEDKLKRYKDFDTKKLKKHE